MSSPLFKHVLERSSGVLLHPTSLPSRQGVGNLGENARALIDFLADAGFSFWQVCPLGPTGFGDSPYQCFSAMAGNPYLIDVSELLEHGLLAPDEFASLEELPSDHVDYGRLYKRFWPLMRLAHKRFSEKGLAYLPNYGDYAAFKADHASWLLPYAQFMALKEHFGGKAWIEWKPESRSYKKAVKSKLLKTELAETVDFHCFCQYLFLGQWRLLRDYARVKGVEVIGDIPIFVAYDSADVWANKSFFQLKKDGSPKAVAGVPPDYFSEDGQLWGNPLFDWDALAKDGYAWWLERLAMNFELYDVVRIDHFRGFYDYWAVPAGEKTARKGKWRKGPALKFFKAVRERFPEARLIAEDLGDVNEGVRTLLRDTGLPGMAILQFAFSHSHDDHNHYLPHNVSVNTVIYPGTHDNNTTLGWYEEADEAVKDHVRRYLEVDGSSIAWDMARTALASRARLAVVPLQDLFNLDAKARMNTPGEAMGNWQWRYLPDQLKKLSFHSLDHLKDLNHQYSRIPER